MSYTQQNAGLPVSNAGVPIPIVYTNTHPHVLPHPNPFVQTSNYTPTSVGNASLAGNFHSQYPLQNRRKRRGAPANKSIVPPKNGRIEVLEEHVKALLREKEETAKAAAEKIISDQAAKLEEAKLDLERREARLAKDKAKLEAEKVIFELEKSELAKDKAKFQMEKEEAAKPANNVGKKMPWYRRPIF